MKGAGSVLIVEDDDWFAEQQMRILKKAGYHVDRVTHGLDAIEALDESLPDILILDIFLPGTNVVTLLHELQSHEDLASIPVIICSNSAAELSQEMLQTYGVRHIVDKTTMQPSDLVAAVKRELE